MKESACSEGGERADPKCPRLIEDRGGKMIRQSTNWIRKFVNVRRGSKI